MEPKSKTFLGRTIELLSSCRALLPVAALALVTGCHHAGSPSEHTSATSSALTQSDVFGFEDPTAWSTTVSGATLTRSTTHDQGSFSLQLATGPSTGYTPITSTPMSMPAGLGPHLDFDIMLPSQQPNPSWYGTAQIYVNCASRNVNNVFLGQIELTGKPLNTWVTLDFAVQDTLLTPLLQSGYTDLKITLIVNVPFATTPQVPHLGVYKLDNLRFVPAAANQCPGRPNGTSCTDGNACTGNDTCQSGHCVAGGAVTCTTDQCHTVGACVPASGCPAPVAKADGTSCNDGNACTDSDACQSGVCAAGNPKSCFAQDQCHGAGTCNPATGACSNPVLADGTTCSDGDACTSADKCQAGACTSGAHVASCNVTPVFEGIATSGGKNYAVFGYTNSTQANAHIPYGADNNIVDGNGSIPPLPSPPPEWFLSDTHEGVLVEPITSTLIWTIRSQQAVANVNGPSLPVTQTPRGPVATLPDGTPVQVDFDPAFGVVQTDTTTNGVTPGKTPGNFAVTADGAGSYTLPLWVPPGRGGLQPELALAYNSRVGSGHLGVGWALSGLSEISRCVKTVGRDGVASEPSEQSWFSGEKALCLDGKRLLPVSGDGGDGTVYFEEDTDFTQVVQHGPVDDVMSFEVKRRDGSVGTYAEHDGYGGPSWPIGSLKDKAGNLIKYTYIHPTPNFPDPLKLKYVSVEESLISRIDYVFADDGQDEGTRSVVFAYEPLTKWDLKFQFQNKHVNFSRIANIKMYGPNPSANGVLRIYKFAYEQGVLSGRDRLSSVTECDGELSDGAACKRPTSFHYSDDTTQVFKKAEGNFPETTLPAPPATGYGTTSFRLRDTVIDLNGDGLDDVLYLFYDAQFDACNPVLGKCGPVLSGGHFVARLSDGTRLGPEFDVTGQLPASGNSDFYVTDVDGDGRVDVIAPAQPTVEYSLNDYYLYRNSSVRGSTNPSDIHFDKSATPFLQIQSNPNPPLETTLPVFQSRPYFADTDGDGLLDLLQGIGVATQNSSFDGFQWKLSRGQAGGAFAPAKDIFFLNGGVLTGPLEFPHETILTPKMYQRAGRSLLIPTAYETEQIDGGTDKRNVFGEFEVDGDGNVTQHDPSLKDHITRSTVAMDMNGDGLPEIVKLWNFDFDVCSPQCDKLVTAANVNYNTGASFQDELGLSVTTHYPTSGDGAFSMDFNQDDFEDLVLIRDNRDSNLGLANNPGVANASLYLSTGFDFGPESLLVDTAGNHIKPLWREGYTAIGTGGSGNTPETPGAASVIHQATPIDINGDGLTDLLIGPDVWVRQGGKVDLLTGIVDGEAHDTVVTYRSLGDRGPSRPNSTTPFYAHTADSSYPLAAADKGIWAVAEVDVDSGITARNPDPAACTQCGIVPVAPYNAFYYSYENGRENLLDGEWLGFAKRTVYDVGHATTTVTTYDTTAEIYGHDYWGAFRPRFEDTTVALSGHDSGVQANVPTTYHHHVEHQYNLLAPFLSNQHVLAVLPVKIIDDETDTSDVTKPIRHVETSLGYDTYGNVKTRTDQRTGVESLTQTTTYENRTSGSDWLLGLPKLITQTSTPSNGLPAVTRVTDHTYDSKGFLHVETIEPNGDATLHRERTTTWNPHGEVISVIETDHLGHTRSSEIQYDDEDMFPTAHKNALGQITRTVYHPGYGLPVFQIDANGAVTADQYDGFGRHKVSTPADGTTILESYSGPSNPFLAYSILVTGTDGRHILTDYDRIDDPVTRTVRLADGSSSVVTWTYDGYGRLTTQTLPTLAGTPAVAATSYAYDERDRVIRVMRAGSALEGTATSYSFYSGNDTIKADPLVQTDTGLFFPRHLLTKDALGRPQTALDYKDANASTSVATGFSYGAFGVTASVMSAASSIAYEHDVRGRVTAVTETSSGTTTLVHDAFDNLTSYTDQKGQRTDIQVDALNRRQNEQSTLGETTYSWDTAPFGIGKLGNAVSAPGAGSTSVAYVYDAVGRTSEETWNVHGRSFSLDYDYYASGVGRGKLERVTYPAIPGRSARVAVEYGYSNFSGDLVSLGAPGGGSLYYSIDARDAASRVAQETFGSGASRTLGYHSVFNTLTSAHATAGGKVVQDLALAYDGRMEVTSRIERAALAGAPSGEADSYDYDALGRLRHWLSNSGNYSVEYQYDDSGNLVSRQVKQGGTSQPATVFTFGERGHTPQQLTGAPSGEYEYDANGDQISGPDRSVEFSPFHLPLELSVRGSTAQFEYDPWHHRSYKSSPAGTFSYVGGVYERRTDGLGAHHVMHLFAEGREIGELTVDESAANATPTARYLLGDQLGSPDVIVGAVGQIEPARYEPFGARLATGDTPAIGNSGDQAIRVGFAGAEHDDELEVINMGGRIYDPQIGRFLSPDPVVSTPLFSQGHHRYSYAKNSPLSNFDPTGFSDQSLGAGMDWPDGGRPGNQLTQITDLSQVGDSARIAYDPGTLSSLISQGVVFRADSFDDEVVVGQPPSDPEPAEVEAPGNEPEPPSETPPSVNNPPPTTGGGDVVRSIPGGFSITYADPARTIGLTDDQKRQAIQFREFNRSVDPTFGRWDFPDLTPRGLMRIGVGGTVSPGLGMGGFIGAEFEPADIMRTFNGVLELSPTLGATAGLDFGSYTPGDTANRQDLSLTTSPMSFKANVGPLEGEQEVGGASKLRLHGGLEAGVSVSKSLTLRMNPYSMFFFEHPDAPKPSW